MYIYIYIYMRLVFLLVVNMDVSMTEVYSPVGTFFKLHVTELPNTSKPDVLFLIDISARMNGYPIQSIELALKNILPKLTNRKLGFILFNDSVQECFGFVGSRSIQEVLPYLHSICTDGSTCFAWPFKYLRDLKLKNNMIIIFLVDGYAPIRNVNLANYYLQQTVQYQKIKFQIHSICFGDSRYDDRRVLINILTEHTPFSTVQFLNGNNLVQSLDIILPLIIDSCILRVHRNKNECFSVLSNEYFRGPVEKIETPDEKTLNVTAQRVHYLEFNDNDAYKFLNFALRDSAKDLYRTQDMNLLAKFEQLIELREAFGPLLETIKYLRKLINIDLFEEKLTSIVYHPIKFVQRKVEPFPENDELVNFFCSSKLAFTKIEREVLPELSCFVSHESATEAHNNGDILCLCLSHETNHEAAIFNPCLVQVKVLNLFITFGSFKAAVLHTQSKMLFQNLFGFKVTLFLPFFIDQLQWKELGHYYLMAAASIMTTGKLTRVSKKATETLPVLTWIDLVLQEPKTEWRQRLIPLVENIVTQVWKDPYKKCRPSYLRVARLIIAKEDMTLHFEYAVKKFSKEEKKRFKFCKYYNNDFDYLKSIWLDTPVGKLFRYAGIEFDIIKVKCFSSLLRYWFDRQIVKNLTITEMT
jgi:hypothetical protein